MQLSRDTVRERLSSIGLGLFPVPLDKHAQDDAFSRHFIQSIYGGNIQQTSPTIIEKYYQKTGIRDFLYLNLLFHPHAPEVPGAPGMYFSIGRYPAGEWDELMTLFTRLDSNIWGYMGLYQMTPAPSLTKEEWREQSEKMQNTWANAICKDSWGDRVRARILCRKQLGRVSTQEEEDEAYADKTFMTVKPEEVRQAFLNGEELLRVWTMKCVGYNPDLQLNLIENFKTWVPKKRAKGTKKSKPRGKKSGRGGGSTTGRKRKRQEPESEPETDDEGADQDVVVLGDDEE
ncbi:hypothetical protein BDN72DRAFT_772867 [Pluteus cervinus]|uniref:Uncharacterized protein n=1 Tax=Pluteus cervinus TaxID=181527 RepID=A0ACD3AKK5_9AGAR|nr:hypothetical protein BDN72DRAFT_772867 [Pluteus cervinus]